MNTNKPLVSVVMITYGHEKYIVQAVESIMMQQCEFDFELIISNDHSPDSTDYVIKKIIDEHPNSYKIKYHLQKNNIGMIPNFIFALNQAKSRYIALCDGDDYWTDPLKLQKQVDFLEANEDYSICWTKYLIQSITMLNTPDWEIELSAKLPLTIDLNTIFSPYCTYTLTTVFRNNALDCESFSNLKYSKDNTIYAICLTKGKGVLLNFYGGNYRLHEKSTYSSTSLFEQYYFSYLNIHEIISNIKQCNNTNFKKIRNFLLADAISLNQKIFNFMHLKLILHSFLYLGIRKSVMLILINLKNEVYRLR